MVVLSQVLLHFGNRKNVEIDAQRYPEVVGPMKSTPLAPIVPVLLALAPVATGYQTSSCASPPTELSAWPWASFGFEVDQSGDFLAVGDPVVQRVTIYQRGAAATWNELQTLTGPPFTSGQLGFSIAIDGRTLVVSDPPNDEVHVFEYSAGLFTEQAVLAPVSASPQSYGQDIGVHGNRIAVVTKTTSQLYVYRRTGTSWSLEASLSYSTSFDGASVALDGNTILAGNRGKAGGPSGAITEFNWNGSQWVHGASFVAPGTSPLTFGGSLALDGDRFVAGGTDEVFVYGRDGGVWSRTATLRGSFQTGGSFGLDAAIQGDRVIVGSPLELVAGLQVGAVYTFAFAADSWNLVGTLFGDTTEAGNVGFSVSLEHTTIAAGDPTSGSARALVWDGAAPSISYCTAGTSSSGCRATLSSKGCASATAATGFHLLATDVEGDKDGIFFFGTNGRQAHPWGNGTSFQCVVPPVKRGGLLTGGGTLNACDGSFQQDLNTRWQTHPAHNPGAGAVVQAQLWYRNPFGTGNKTTALSDALEFRVGP